MTSLTGTFWDQATETMPREELEKLQAERVRACLERMRVSDIPYYRERLSGVQPGRIRSVDDFERLPFTFKDDLREHYPFGLFLAPVKDIVRIHASSGSTGKPTVVAYTRADLELWADTLARGLVSGGISDEDVFQNALGYGLFTGGLGFHDAATRVGAAVVPTAAGNTARQVMLMRDLGVTAFASTPSYSLHIAEVADAEGMDLWRMPVRAAVLGAEATSEPMRGEIEERMGVTVYEQYGLSEIIGPGVASTCERLDGMHVWEDQFIPEIVDPETDLRARRDAGSRGTGTAGRARGRAGEVLRGALGLSVEIELLAPRTIQRSEGKALRVLDQRTEAP